MRRAARVPTKPHARDRRRRSGFRSALAVSGAVGGLLVGLVRSNARSGVVASLGPRRPMAVVAHATAPADERAKRDLASDRNGRDADTPEHIPPRGWWQIAKRTAAKFSENELMSEAASITFFALLSLFPAIGAMVSIFGLFSNPATIEGHLEKISGFLPSGGMDIIREQVHRLAASPQTGLSLGAAFGILAAIWSANQGSKAMFSALNDVYGETESRGFLRVTMLSLTFTIGGIVFLLAGLGATIVLPLLFDAIGMSGAFDLALKILAWPVALLGVIVGLALLYRYGPSRELARWRWVSWGSVIGALGWVGLSLGFSWYVAHFGSYNKTYGSLGAIIGFMTWIWLSSTVLLLGAQINAEMETQTGRDSTVGHEKPAGTRGSAAADTVSSAR